MIYSYICPVCGYNDDLWVASFDKLSDSRPVCVTCGTSLVRRYTPPFVCPRFSRRVPQGLVEVGNNDVKAEGKNSTVSDELLRDVIETCDLDGTGEFELRSLCD